MRIGLFTDQYYPQISGVVTSIKMLYEGLEALGHECFIFTSYDEKIKDEPELTNKNVINLPGKAYPFKVVSDYRYTLTHKKFVKVIKEYNLDIIHVHTEFNIAKIAKVASKKLGIPIVHTFHTSWKDYIKYLFPKLDKICHGLLVVLLRKMFTKPISKVSVLEILPTKKVENDLKVYGMKRPTRIVPTGIELSRFDKNNFTQEQIKELREKLGINEDDFVFTYVGRTSKEKDIPVIMDGFKDAFNNAKNVKLLIVGGGPYLGEIKEHAEKIGIMGQTIFTDLIPWKEVPLYYQLGDIFCNASQSETQGLTYIEALSSELPVLVRKDECIEEVITHEYNGYTFETHDELVKYMKMVVDYKELLATLRTNTLESIKKYGKEEFTNNILAVYNEAIEIYNTSKKHKNKK